MYPVGPQMQVGRAGRPSRRLAWLALAAAAVVCLALVPVLVHRTGGRGGRPGPGPGLQTEPADYVGPGPSSRPAGAEAFDGRAARLAGPHFTVVFTSVTVTDVLENFRHTAPGQEFLQLTTLTPTLGDVPSPTDPVTARLEVNGQIRPVALRDVQTSGLTVSAPKATPVVLHVSDEGRTQSIDLRIGYRMSDAIPGYYPARLVGWRGGDYSEIGRSDVDGCRRATNLLLGFDEHETVLLPWGPRLGWARPGKAWLPLSYSNGISPITLPDYDRVTDWPYVCANEVNFHWDLSGSVALQLPGGTVRPVQVTSGASGTVVFQVPITLTRAALVVRPTGLLVGEDGHSHRTGWTGTPPVRRTTLTAR